MENNFYVTSQLSEINVPWVVEQLRQTYWANWRSAELITESLHNSLCFGVFERTVLPEVTAGHSHKDKQVGFGRVVTDYSTVAYIVDIFVHPDSRGIGVGRFLMDTISADHRIKNLVQLLRTRPATETFYTKRGFTKVIAYRKLPHENQTKS